MDEDEIIEGSDDISTTNDPNESNSGEDNSFLGRAARATQQLFSSDDSDDETVDDIPTEETEDKTEETEKTDDPAEEATEDKGETKETRASRFKDTVAANERMTGELAEINTKLEKFGGVEGFNHFSGVIEAFMNPEESFEIGEGENKRTVSGKEMIYDFVNELPGAGDIYSDFFIKGLTNVENRVFAINDVLKSEFNLRADANLTQDQMNTVFDYVTAKINTAKTPQEIEKVFNSLSEEVALSGYDAQENTLVRENEELKRQLADLQNPKAKAETADTPSFEQEYTAALETEAKHFQSEDELIIKTFDTEASALLETAGWKVSDADSPQLKQAKTRFNDILLGRDNVAQKIRNSKAFAQVSSFMRKGTLESTTGRLAVSNFNTAVRSTVNSFLQDLQLLKAEASPAPAPKTTTPAGSQRNSIKPTENTDEKLDFRARAEQTLGRKITRM